MTNIKLSSSIGLNDVEVLVKSVFGVSATAQKLLSEYDEVFRLVTTDSESLIVKVMHSSRTAEFVDMQCGALEQLERTVPNLNLPRVLRTKTGRAFERISDSEGQERIVWALTYLPGKTLYGARPHSPDIFQGIGELLGHIDKSLLDFHHRAAKREFKWDLSKALWIREYVHEIHDAAHRSLILRAIDRYTELVVPQLVSLGTSVIHGDANDYNVLIDDTADSGKPSIGLIDFGDMHEGLRVAEPAVASAYAALGKQDPLSFAASVVAGYDRVIRLEERELKVLFPLIVMRLAVSVVNSALERKRRPEDAYVSISEGPAWAALEKLDAIDPKLAEFFFRSACGRVILPKSMTLRSWLEANQREFAPVVGVDFRNSPPHVIDLSISSPMLGADPKSSDQAVVAKRVVDELATTGKIFAIGRYGEARYSSSSERLIGVDNAGKILRNIHIGIDVFSLHEFPVCSPLAAKVHKIMVKEESNQPSATIILRHECGDELSFYTIYRNVLYDRMAPLSEEQSIKKGQIIGSCFGLSPLSRCGVPHLHFQLAADLLDTNEGLPGFVEEGYREVWRELSPDPNLILGVASEEFPVEWSEETTIKKRNELLGRSLRTSYEMPIKVVRGWKQFLYDQTGRAYLDVFNNVPLVGHGHPRVVEAVCRQMRLLNTNTRYLHDNILRYAERLSTRLPEKLRVFYFVNSGSEANELAIRMARIHTGGEEFIVLENAYHGNTATATDISPYKFNGPGGRGKRPWVHVAPIPDDYRGAFRRGESSLGEKYAVPVKEILADLRHEGRRVAGYIAESVPSVGGQVFFPDDYLREVYGEVRRAGGVCIADEVQVGFGRLGSAFWGFETQGVVPDVVVLAKPIGNCFPLAAVVTTREVAESFNNGMEFFSTFGGNPVSCAAGLAVLDVLEDERLQENALQVGNYFKAALHDLQARHSVIGDVRGRGLFLGIDLVRSQETRSPATSYARRIVGRLRDLGVLVGTDGPHQNVIKLRPPLIFSERDVDLFASVLSRVLQENSLAE